MFAVGGVLVMPGAFQSNAARNAVRGRCLSLSRQKKTYDKLGNVCHNAIIRMRQ